MNMTTIEGQRENLTLTGANDQNIIDYKVIYDQLVNNDPSKEECVAVEGRVERKRAMTRERLVDTALALFAKQGIYVTTVEDITDAADVGKGTFYQHFPSKTAIIRYLLHTGMDELLERCRREVQSGASARERLERLVAAQLRFFQKRRDLLIVFHQVRGLLKLKPRDVRSLQKEYDRYIRFLTAELGTLVDRRRWSQVRLMHMACAMAGLVTGYLSYGMILGLQKQVVADLEVPLRLVLEGIATNVSQCCETKAKQMRLRVQIRAVDRAMKWCRSGPCVGKWAPKGGDALNNGKERNVADDGEKGRARRTNGGTSRAYLW